MVNWYRQTEWERENGGRGGGGKGGREKNKICIKEFFNLTC